MTNVSASETDDSLQVGMVGTPSGADPQIPRSDRGSDDLRSASDEDPKEAREASFGRYAKVLVEDRARTDGSFDPRVLDDIVADVVAETHGTIVYQEQTLVMLRRLGFSWEEADAFIKSLKINVKTLALSVEAMYGFPVYVKLVKELKERYGASDDAAWAFVKRFTSYQFNKSHAVGYALTSYYQMYMKTYYPLEFWCAVLQAEGVDERRTAYLAAAARDGVVFLPPHANGTRRFSIENNAIRVGTESIKNVGSVAAEVVERHRPYSSLEDFLSRVPKRQVNARVVSALQEAGALEFDRDVLVARAVAYNHDLKNTRVSINVFQGGATHG